MSVVQTLMPASSSSSMSCQRFGWRGAGSPPTTLECASSSTSRIAGPALQRGVEVELLAHDAAVARRQRRQPLEPLHQPLGLGAAVRLDVAHHDLGAADPRRLRGARASSRSCRRRPSRRRKSAAGRAAHAPPRPATRREQLVGIGPRFDCHQLMSSARAGIEREVELEHVDRGSPSMPSVRPSVCSRTSAASSASSHAARARDSRDLILGGGDG